MDVIHYPLDQAFFVRRIRPSRVPFYHTACGSAEPIKQISADPSGISCPACLELLGASAEPDLDPLSPLPAIRSPPGLPPGAAVARRIPIVPVEIPSVSVELPDDDWETSSPQISTAERSEASGGSTPGLPARPSKALEDPVPVPRPIRDPLPVPEDEALLSSLLSDPSILVPGFGIPDIRFGLPDQDRQEFSKLFSVVSGIGMAQMAVPLLRGIFRLLDRIDALSSPGTPSPSVSSVGDEVGQDVVLGDETEVTPPEDDSWSSPEEDHEE